MLGASSQAAGYTGARALLILAAATALLGLVPQPLLSLIEYASASLSR